MKSVPTIPKSDNVYELAMHAGNINEYERELERRMKVFNAQYSFNPKIEALHATGTAIGVQFVVGFVVLLAVALFLVPQ